MQKDPHQRYQSWFEFGRDLAGLVRGLGEPTESLSDARKFHALRDFSLFRSFSQVELWETLRLATWKGVPQGTVIIAEGGSCDALYLLLHGRVEVTRAGARLATLAPGDLFGEILYFDEVTERNTTVRSMEDVLLLEIKAMALNSASETCQVQFNKACMRLLVERLSSANRRLARR